MKLKSDFRTADLFDRHPAKTLQMLRGLLTENLVVKHKATHVA